MRGLLPPQHHLRDVLLPTAKHGGHHWQSGRGQDFQQAVPQADVKRTSIITPFGLFEFLWMPFGLKNASMMFQRFMDRVLAGLPFILVYLDDIWVASTDRQSHTAHLRLVR